MLLSASFGQPGFDVLFVLAAALLVDCFVRDVPTVFQGIPHPVRMIGGLIARLDVRLNRPTRSERDRFLRGMVVVIAITGLVVVVGSAWVVLRSVVPWLWVVEVLCVSCFLAQRSLHDHVRAVADGLQSNGLAGGRQAVAQIVGRDPARLDVHGVARAAIESCAENFSDAVVAPAFWFVVLGLPGLLAYKAINTLDSMIAYRTPRYEAFGKAAAKVDDVVNWIPARLSAVYIALASAIAGVSTSYIAFVVAMRDAHKHRSPNAGWPEGAMAGALDLSLAGPRRYSSYVVDDEWIGDGRARATEDDIRKALRVFIWACLLNGFVVILGALILLLLSIGQM